ncbi:MAG: NeuD/PglB/VioB family sugar acetyltransferase [Sulfurovum sp.]|nr:NeuD/PglB/VioB family sugar acetyltransferase [Sulfurovum sp.]
MQKLILLGGGGHCKSCIDVIEQEGKYEIIGILDDEKLIGQKILGYDFIGTDDDITKFSNKGYLFLITVGQIKTSNIRRKLFGLLNESNAQIATVISPLAYISRHSSIGKGTIIMHDSLVNADASIGKNCIINSKALIEHDVIIEDFCHISTAAVVNGGAVVKEGSFFGSNAVSKEYVETSIDDFVKAGTTFKGNS